MKILQVQDWKINAQVESTILFSIQFEVSHMPIIFYSEVSFIQNTKYKSVKSKEEKKKKEQKKRYQNKQGNVWQNTLHVIIWAKYSLNLTFVYRNKDN